MVAVNRGKRLRAMPVEQYREKLRNQILSYTKKSDNCWIWEGQKQRNGYGSTKMYGKTTPAHRAAYFAFVGEIGERNEICHTCDVRNCVNPDHLFQATHSENMKDMSKKGRGRNGIMSGACRIERNKLGQFFRKDLTWRN